MNVFRRPEGRFALEALAIVAAAAIPGYLHVTWKHVLVLVVAVLILALAALVEVEFEPPIWVHIVLWTPLIIGGAIWMLRPLKAGMIALQYRHYLLHAPPTA